MNKRYATIYRLQETLSDLEEDLGLGDLGDHERRVFLAAVGVANSQDACQTKDIVGHRLLRGISRPSIFRALNKLLERGLLSQEQEKKGHYRIVVAPQ